MANIEEERSKRNLMSEEPEMGPAPRRILIDPSKVGRGVEQTVPGSNPATLYLTT
jgi:hypothetical protein